jgi:hypothetical protein
MQNTTVRTLPSKGHRDHLTDRDNGGAVAFFHPPSRRDLNLGFALFADTPAQPVNVIAIVSLPAPKGSARARIAIRPGAQAFDGDQP